MLDELLAGHSAGGLGEDIECAAGPGHVIYSAFAGYYLGLAKFNPRDAGPIVVKGLIIAALIHAVYNSLSSVVPGVVTYVFNVPWFLAFVGFVVVYDGLFGYLLYRKLKRYAAAYHVAHEDEIDESEFSPEMAEFDG